jgi:FkbM family methyltransferase
MARPRATPASAWTHDARNRVAVGRGVRLRYVSRADVKFMHDEIFERECYGCAAIADASKKAGVVIDVGANVGLSALWFAARSDVVIACEPIPRTFAALVENVGARENRGGETTTRDAATTCGVRGVEIKGAARDGRGMATVYAHDVGVGAERRDAADFVEFPRAAGWATRENARDDAETTENLIAYVLDALRGDGGGDDGLESNVVVGAGRWLRARVADDDDDATPLRRLASVIASFVLRVAVRCVAAYMLSGARVVKRPVVTVSDLIEAHGLDSVDLLKIDVERAELDVLNGVDETDWGKIQRVHLECHDSNFDRAVEVLKSKGAFDVVRVDALFGSARLRNIRASRRVAS